jgi:thioredoxin-related protein
MQPPYKRFPTIPPLKLMPIGSTTIFTKDQLKKNRPVLIMLFSPDCEHCQHETEELIKNIDHFKKIQIVMATMMPFDKMTAFYDRYDLKRFDNIVVGQDIYYLLPSFFKVRNLPYMAMYDKKGKLLSTFEGNMSMDKLEKIFD